MDNLTHGLFGLAIGALRRPDRRPDGSSRRRPGQAPNTSDAAPERAPLSATDRAVLAACVVAAELPDLDTFWPSGNDVLQALHAHRGPTHAILFAPLVALVAVALVRPFFRGARMPVMFAWALPSTLLAHLLADAWTGWGTRLFLPFSDRRLSLDWTLVVDPLVTVPLLLGALAALVLALRGRQTWRTAILVGFALSAAYVAARVAVRSQLLARVAAEHPGASRVEVFPLPFDPVTWRYAVLLDGQYRLGTVRPFGSRTEQGVHDAALPELPPAAREDPTVREALAWARLPLITVGEAAPENKGGGHALLRIADLRYHFAGEPTLAFHFELNADGTLRTARFDRGGSARELLRRLRAR